MNTQFNNWWDEDLLLEDNPFVDGTPAFWAWEGWCAAVKAEREACAMLAEKLTWADNMGVASAIRARNPK